MSAAELVVMTLTVAFLAASAAVVALLVRVRSWRLRLSTLEATDLEQRDRITLLTADVHRNAEQARRWRDQRNGLVRAAVHVAINVQSAGLRDGLDLALRTAGVDTISPDGEQFDPCVHRAVRRLPIADPSRQGVVAETVRNGYRDGTHLLRAADVAVYELEPSARPSHSDPKD